MDNLARASSCPSLAVSVVIRSVFSCVYNVHSEVVTVMVVQASIAHFEQVWFMYWASSHEIYSAESLAVHNLKLVTQPQAVGMQFGCCLTSVELFFKLCPGDCGRETY